MTKTQTRAKLENAGGTTEKSANSGVCGKIFCLAVFLEAMAAPACPRRQERPGL